MTSATGNAGRLSASKLGPSGRLNILVGHEDPAFCAAGPRLSPNLTVPSIGFSGSNSLQCLNQHQVECVVQVLVIDNEPVVKAGITLWLKKQAEVLNKDVDVKYANGCEQALQIEAKDKYELVLLDYHMPGGIEGIDALHAIKDAFVSSAIVMYSGEVDKEKILETVDEGACGFIPKSFDEEEVVSAVECVLKTGGLYLPPQALGGVRAYRAMLSPPDQRLRDEILEALTPQQKRVLKLAVQGMKRELIASKIYKSISTVKTHLSHAYEVLNVANRTEAVQKTIMLQLFVDDDG